MYRHEIDEHGKTLKLGEAQAGQPIWCVTQGSYIKMVRPDVTAAMKSLEAKVQCAANVQQ